MLAVAQPAAEAAASPDARVLDHVTKDLRGGSDTVAKCDWVDSSPESLEERDSIVGERIPPIHLAV